jgi:hypothetical protein
LLKKHGRIDYHCLGEKREGDEEWEEASIKNLEAATRKMTRSALWTQCGEKGQGTLLLVGGKVG